MEKQKSIFETTNVGLASYLMLEGIKFLEYKVDYINSVKRVVILRFLDEKENCRDLERVYMGSDFKKYRDYTQYILKEIHKKLRE